ncbi:MAG: biotin--[acetyl-CoA-carboxylase] ligase [Thermanaerothrix sp.]|uniref:Biotin--[acetyl-CoA-carboxylase] ligase n=1 Tax=Thermanaerothrix solaris TaxID=3058434 RepID=A0ABU3NQ57_9CHLR|nr:biotin--[acetyl-CoA-carboxylase] ligase [Thermanaerothrix sp. 4228-RoL]MDT8898976.1 biotin--[acetyl-CoA-carboxylase] ligase [Thermanaerothrix sp. 4228-RoL]
MMESAALEHWLRDLNLPAWQYYEEVGSTNDIALAWLDQGAPDGALVVAGHQTQGRGRLGRTWITVPEAGLAFTLIVRPNAQLPFPVERLTALGALAVAQAFKVGFGVDAHIKWPNDVLIDKRKVCGILVELAWQEEQLQGAVVGIGINVGRAAVPPAEGLHYPAISLEEVLGHPINRWDVLRRVLEAFFAWRHRLTSPEFMIAWEDHLAFRGEWVQASDGHNPPLIGRVKGLSPEGHLRLRLEDGTEYRLNAGEIRPLAAPFAGSSGGEDA